MSRINLATRWHIRIYPVGPDKHQFTTMQNVPREVPGLKTCPRDGTHAEKSTRGNARTIAMGDGPGSIHLALRPVATYADRRRNASRPKAPSATSVAEAGSGITANEIL